MPLDYEQSLLKRKIIPGPIEIHQTECALVVHYTIQAMVMADGGVVGAEKKSMKKIIRVRGLNPSTDIYALAEDVIAQCKLIPATKIKEVEQSIYFLYTRHVEAGMNNSLTKGGQMDNDNDDDCEASLDQLDHYTEMLYEETAGKVRATNAILKLAKQIDNLEALASNEPLMSALSRVLREDSRKSMELASNIIYTFFCFSNYSHYHPLVTQCKVGDMCLKIADNELARVELLTNDLQKLESKSASNPKDAKLVKEVEQEHRKFQSMIRKQDQLLFACFYTLMNLAEDMSIEVKMVKREIVKYLIILVERQTPELQLLAVTFLKKLSVFRENKEQMVIMADALISKLLPFIPCEQPALLSVSLRLLLNLSHDANFRAALVKCNLLPRLVDILTTKQKHMTPVVLQLLYMLSLEDHVKSTSSFTPCIPGLVRMILDYRGDKVHVDLMAIAVNLSMNPSNAEMMMNDGGLKRLMKRGLRTRDPLVFKLLRNIASHDNMNLKMPYLDYIDELMKIAFKAPPELSVEVLGIFSTLTIPDFDWAKLSEHFNLISWMATSLASLTKASDSAVYDGDDHRGIIPDDDVVLEIVVLLGNMAHDDGIVPLIFQHNVIPVLMELMLVKEDDDEIILQIIYCVFQFMLHESTRTYLISKTQVVSLLIDLLYDRNPEIRRACDACLDIIGEISDEWVTKIRSQKFHWHNSEWVKTVTENVKVNSQKSGKSGAGKSSGAQKKQASGIDVNDDDDSDRENKLDNRAQMYRSLSFEELMNG